MPKKTNVKEDLRTEVYELQKSYLARHPQEAFQTALDAVDLITSKLATTELVNWRDSLQNIAEQEKQHKSYAIPATHRRTIKPKPRSKKRGKK